VFYHLLTPLVDTFSAFNVFNYITFRAACAASTAILLAFFVGPSIIRALNARGVGQVVRGDGPASHHTKRGTPTMGGLILLLCTIIPTLLWARLDNQYVLLAALAMIWMGGIGFVDDYLKIVEGKPRGLVARYKLVGQVTFGIALGLTLLFWPVWPTEDIPADATTLPFFKYVLVPLTPVVYIAFVTFILTGFSNAVNLTDGLDGLAAGLTVIAAGAFAVFSYIFGHAIAADYLLVYFMLGAGELSVFCAALMGAALGFLWFNSHPAEVFMGDTGSLAIGGAFGTVAILLKSEFLLLLVGGVFVAETASVIIQTGAFRWRKHRFGRDFARKHRVFRMAPLHHHFEQLGWTESKIVSRFYIIGILCAIVALATLKFR
jgi:phospho-N-acetylmuramoyl-pentapeptide-transferase